MTAQSAPHWDAEAVHQWIANDPDPVTRAELTALLALAVPEGDAVAGAGPDGAVPDGAAAPAADSVAAAAELADRFSGPLEFGTAGLRGRLGAGPNRMNRAVVIRAAAGLSAFLLDTVGPGFSVVIGADARHGSGQFALDTAAVVSAAGGRAVLLPPMLPTPVLAFTVRSLDADAGVMVTASHNPREDNGCKVYLGHSPLRTVAERLGEPVAAALDGAGAQIVSPIDAMIAQHIAQAPPAAEVPRTDDAWERRGDEIAEAYLQRVESLPARAAGPLRIVLTSLHGVGGATALEALRRCGFTDVHVVEAQSRPDPEFPTVEFPNPEEPGALDLAYALAEEIDADLIIAHDPDADRFSAAVPADDGAQTETSGGWVQLSGDEVGLLLGERIAARCADLPEAQRADLVLASSMVSSRALAEVARHHGLRHVHTLTGFKWISRVPGLVFGYEEALGYCLDPEAVRDKDGITASIEFAALASELRAAGRSVHHELARIRARDGVCLTAPLTFRLESPAEVAAAASALLLAPPEVLGGSPVVTTTDLAAGSDALPPTAGLLLVTAGGDRVVIRPSGTEPKLKCYLEVYEPPGEDSHAMLRTAGARLTMLLDDLRAFIVQR